MSDYQNAETALVKMQQLEPHRMKGLDVLSTTLWHLKKEVELSDLAQRAVDFDRMAPQAWFVVGNCFSFQKEHDTAITFFHRSIQLDPTYTYAHTLCGHEYMSNEDFDKAISCYRDAIRVDARHYNGENFQLVNIQDICNSIFFYLTSFTSHGSVVWIGSYILSSREI